MSFNKKFFSTGGIVASSPSGVEPTDNFDIATYTGNATFSNTVSQTVTGIGFSPSLVWVKNRDNANNHVLFDSVRGATNWLNSNNTNAEYNNATTADASLTSDGFTTGTSDQTNRQGDDLVAWCWKAGGAAVSNTDGTITSTVSANQDAGFSIVEVDFGTNSTETVGHGLNQAPEFIISKRTSTTSNWDCYHKYIDATAPENYIISLNLSGARIDNNTRWNDTAPTNSVFTTGSQFDNNETVIFYCFHSVDGYQKVGSYSGLGSSAKTVYTTDDGTSSGTGGFEPRFLLIKRYDSTGGDWYIYDQLRDGTNDRQLYANTSDDESTTADVITYNSDGFTIAASGSGVNSSSSNFIYLAIA